MSERIKLSEIRAKFPMYADVSDDQLLIGLRNKFYSDIPPEKFYSRIEYDTGPKVTDEMSGTQRFLAGAGKAFADIGRGVGQFTGLVSRDDVKQSRKTDADLMSTGAGKAGNIVGNVAALLPTALIPGAATIPGAAAIGAGTGLVQPSESTGETLQNIGMGSAAGAGGVVAGRLLGAGYNAARGLIDPFTKKGQERIAASTLQQFATDPQRAAANLRTARELVPGSAPTMAQAADDVGLAQLERTLVNNPETGGLLADRYAAQRAARLGAVGNLAGDAEKRAAAVAAREAATKELYDQATQAVYRVDDQLADLLRRPIMKSAISRAQTLAENKGGGSVQFMTESVAPFSGVGGAAQQVDRQITGKGLQDLKMAIDDMLSDPMAGIGKNEAGAVKAVRAQLIDWMENANPAFKAARQTFAEKSTPINTMDVASELMKRMEPALARYGANTREHAQAYAQALDAAKETVKKSTGINRPMDAVIDSKAKEILENVARDMARKARAEDMGRAAGSNTAQNLAAQNLLRRTLGPTGLPETFAEQNWLQIMTAPVTGLAKLTGSENATMGLLADAALDPRRAAGLLSMAQQPSRLGLLGVNALRYAPAGGLVWNAPQE